MHILMKTCTKCQTPKAHGEFYQDRGALRSRCKECTKADERARNAKLATERKHRAEAALSDSDCGHDWRPTAGFEGYQVNEAGDVRRTKQSAGTRAGTILKANLDSRGYPSVSLWVNGRRHAAKIHRLVAEAFHGPRPSPLHEVAHNNGDPTDNRAANLRWATRAENHADKIQHGTHNRGHRHGLSKLTIEQIRWAEERRKEGVYVKDIAAALGVGYGTITKALRRESWSWLDV